MVVGEGRLDPRGPGVRRLGRVDDLGALYAGALAVVLPSWLEGFGLPPRRGAGAPARPRSSPTSRCCARCWASGALYVPPGDAEALADALLSLAARPGAARAAARRRPARIAAADLGRDRRGARAPCWRRRPAMSFSIVVVLHDSAGAAARAARLARRALPPAPQLIVVDTASSDDGPALARAAGAEVVELGANPGFGAANNAGVERARAPRHRAAQPGLRAARRLARPARRARGRAARCGSRGCSNPDGSVQRSAHPLPGTVGALLPAARAPADAARRRCASGSSRSGRSARAASAGRSRPAWPRRRRRCAGSGRSTPASSCSTRTWTCACAPAPPGSRRCSSRRSASATSAATRPARATTASRTTCWRNAGARSWAPTAAPPRSRSTTLAQALTFATRAAGRLVLGRDADRERAQLAPVARTGTMTPCRSGSSRPRTATPSSRWSTRAAICTGPGRIRPSAPTSSTSC